MAKKRDRTLEQLDALKALEGKPLEGETLKHVEKALASRNNLVAAAAVRLAVAARDPRWIGSFEEVFTRFMRDPVKSDPACKAKQAAVEALQQLEADTVGVYTTGIDHVQMEPIWGGQEDTAAQLRGHCLGGLVSMGHRDALFYAVPLLADPESETRFLAVQALRHTGVEGAELLLRLKVHAGDRDARVTSACFSALVALNPGRSLPFVAGFLDQGHGEITEAAALALGESRREEAFSYLHAYWEKHLGFPMREPLILPMALLREEKAFAFLAELIAHADSRYGVAAIKALGVYHADQSIYTRVAQALGANPSPEINQAFEQYFEDA